MMGGGCLDQQKVPFWIGTDCKLVSGINKSTTCQDVIRSLIHSKDSSKFAIVEKWRKMERKLDPSVRILKVWKAWGDQKNDVTLILRYHHSSTDGYIDKKISNKVLRRKSSSNHHTHHHKLSNQVEESEDEVPPPLKESMEHLLKLVLTQGETIQAQLKKLRHQEEQIERYEERMHRVRSLQDGENYVVESYLRDEKCRKINQKRDKSPRKSSGTVGGGQDTSGRKQQKNCDSEEHRLKCNDGNIASGSSVESSTIPVGTDICLENIQDDLDDPELVIILQQNELLERIYVVNTKLTKEEERLLKLGFKLKKFYESRLTSSTSETSTTIDLMNISPEECTDFQALTELEVLRSVTIEQAKEIEENEENLTKLEQFLDAKQDHVTQLNFLMKQLDQERDVLKQKLQQVHFQKDFDDNNILLKKSTIENPCLQQQPKNSTILSSSSPSSEDSSLHCQCLHPCSSNHNSIGTQDISKRTACRDHLLDNDSNSDTGISSLHSSGDENTLLCVLDTLV